MRFFNDVERVIEEMGDRGVEHLEFYQGIDLYLCRGKKGDAYSKVHGIDAGQPVERIKEFVGVLQGDDFFESNTTQTPAFVAGFLYTREEGIMVGDVIEIKSLHERHRRYKITKCESIGLTRQVFKRYKLSAMGN